MSYYRYNGVKIHNNWAHPTLKNKDDEAVFFRYAKWFDSVENEQELLAVYGVTRHADEVKPVYDSYYQHIVEQADGTYLVEDLPLNNVKARKKDEINIIRDNKETEGFLHGGAPFDSNQRSADRIQIATIAANSSLLNQMAFSIEWTDASNDEHALDAQGMLGLTQSFAEHGKALHERAKALKAQVDACETGAEVKAVEWPE